MGMDGVDDRWMTGGKKVFFLRRVGKQRGGGKRVWKGTKQGEAGGGRDCGQWSKEYPYPPYPYPPSVLRTYSKFGHGCLWLVDARDRNCGVKEGLASKHVRSSTCLSTHIKQKSNGILILSSPFRLSFFCVRGGGGGGVI